ncbi:hypothetical protein B0T19DRAFT_7196 [Cercophora scortea]|uniref:Uncharacterized protein n=1 Tax=Cercophora scortea TaxID=314031 RepID=A0AAE0J1X5_9PEZI|nr:hypothetical protein B0T19DRAFT_7196 [Cercophora scortea]
MRACVHRGGSSRPKIFMLGFGLGAPCQLTKCPPSPLVPHPYPGTRLANPRPMTAGGAQRVVVHGQPRFAGDWLVGQVCDGFRVDELAFFLPAHIHRACRIRVESTSTPRGHQALTYHAIAASQVIGLGWAGLGWNSVWWVTFIFHKTGNLLSAVCGCTARRPASIPKLCVPSSLSCVQLRSFDVRRPVVSGVERGNAEQFEWQNGMVGKVRIQGYIHVGTRIGGGHPHRDTMRSVNVPRPGAGVQKNRNRL